MKKLFNILLVLFMCSVPLFSMEWKYNEGVLTISGKGDIKNFKWTELKPWNKIEDGIISIVIEDGITSIGNNCFSYCRNLVEVSMPDSLTSIGEEAFMGCDNLKDIRFSVNLVNIGNQAFAYCNKLAKITLPSSVQRIGGKAFPDDCMVIKIYESTSGSF